MKKFLKSIVLVAVTLSLGSCSDNDDNQTNDNMSFSQVTTSGALPLGLRGHKMIQFNNKLWIFINLIISKNIYEN